MDYKKHYNNLIISRFDIKDQRTILKKTGEYFEHHHIIPKSQGGNNSPNNIVLLTAREHFIAHWLLMRSNPNKSNIYSFWRMCISNNTPIKYRNSRAYEEGRLNFSKVKKGNINNKGRKM